MDDFELKAEEEAKRERNWDPIMRWQVIQRTIEWADQQQAIPRNSPQGCRQAEARLLALLEEDKVEEE